MNNCYLNVKQYGDSVLYRGIKDNKKIQIKVPYTPELFVPISKESKYKTIFGENLKKIRFDSIKKSKEFVQQYNDVDNFNIYGNTKYEYCLISDIFKDNIFWDISQIRIAIFDIEVDSNPDTGGFASPENSFQPIISIALKFFGENKIYILGCNNYMPKDNETFVQCKDEADILNQFISLWSENYPDIVSGWNVQFDIKYLISRAKLLFGDFVYKKLSPWNIIHDKITKKFNPRFNKYEEETSYSLIGISIIDYLDLYKKYQPGGNSRESYKLDSICELEIHEKKVEFEGSLHKLYTENKQKFYEYNIRDVILIENLDKKCKLFELGLTLAYDSKTNFEDIFHQTRMWDALIFNFLRKKNIQIPQLKERPEVSFEGAYVKPPIIGMHKWLGTLDATSLYPSTILSSNISPETFIEKSEYTPELYEIISKVHIDSLLNKTIDLDYLQSVNSVLTCNGQLFRRDKQGFLPELIQDMFDKRQKFKKKKLSAEREREKLISLNDKSVEAQEKINQLSYDISRYDNLQNAKKLCLNSAYGALGNRYFRFYDARLAEAITLQGQLSNRWIIKNINEYFNKLFKTNKDYCIFGDTDSICLSLENLVNKICKSDYDDIKIVNFLLKSISDIIQPKVNNFCDDLSSYMNFYENKISYKLEKICSVGVVVAKKRYALKVYSNEGVVYSKPKIKVTGLEIIKSSTPKIIRDALRTCLELILNGNEQEFQTFLSKFRAEFKNFTIEEIAFPKGINGLNKYYDLVEIYKKSTPIHVRGSLLYNKFLIDNKLNNVYESIKDGDKIKFCYLKVPNILKENVISFPEKLPTEFNLLEYIDYNMMFDKVFIEPLKSIVEIIGWELEKSNTLERFIIRE